MKIGGMKGVKEIIFLFFRNGIQIRSELLNVYAWGYWRNWRKSREADNFPTIFCVL